jgi:tRNA (guanine37-N1)-methyltransferase
LINFNILSLFPEIFENFFNISLLKKAVENNLISYNLINIRDFSEDKHKVVDDTPYGGGYGMVLKVEPIYRALSSLTNKNAGTKILLSAKGKKLSQDKVVDLSKEENITLICGRYEGIDERVVNFIDEEISIGDYILMGGESAACCLIESISRLIPGVIGKEESAREESFSSNYIEYPQYTKPREFLDYKVPEVLFSGNHGEIKKFRKLTQINTTLEKRPDLIKNRKLPLFSDETAIIKDFLLKKNYEIFIALIHYPVYNKNKEEVATAITNLDIHDIARVSKTYEVKKYFIVNPVQEQINYARRIINHWTEGFGFKYNKNRSTALSIIEFSENIENCIEYIKKITKKNLIVLGTSAQNSEKLITIAKAQELLENNAILLVFGTGWGLTDKVLKQVDFMLEPLHGIGNFNHLSVRSAVSIILDRLIGF